MAQKILIVGPAWIGDMVMLQVLAKDLKIKNPDHIIDVLAPQWSATVLKRVPEVRRAIVFDSQHGKLSFFQRIKFGQKLHVEKYDKAIIIPRSLKCALIPFFARIKTRTGFLGELRYFLLNDIRKLDKDISSMTVKKILALGLEPDEKLPEKIPYPQLKIDPDQQKLLIKKFKLDANKKIIGLMPGAEYGPAKQWPAGHFAAVAKAALTKDYQLILFGSLKDKSIADEINQLSGNKLINLCGKTTIENVIDLLDLCDKVLSNDSGLMHVAAAVGSEVHAIYGSSSPHYTPPLTGKKHIYNLNLECSPCFNRTCRFKTYECLRLITPESIAI